MKDMKMSTPRELTNKERTAIKKLVVSLCANYDYEYGCLPLGCPCVMLNKCWTGAYCRYFREAVLPADPNLEAAVSGRTMKKRSCAVCGTPFPMNGRKAYCSTACAEKAHRKQKRDSIRRKREADVDK
jgi:predicted nucleic acid-binding Zn ribbon protein